MKTKVYTLFAGVLLVNVGTLLGQPTAFVRVSLPDSFSAMAIPHWVDLEGDGWLELVVCGGYTVSGGKPLMVFRNNHDGTLSRDLSHDLAKVSGRFVNGAWADLDNDGHLDAFFGQHEAQTPLYLHNEGGGKFTRIVANGEWTANGLPTVGLNAACADLENDGFLDLVIGCYGNYSTGVWKTNTVLRGLGDGRFEVDRTSPLALSIWLENLSWADWNGDGRLDLFIATSWNDSQRDLMFQNLGGGQFLQVTDSPFVQAPHLSIAASWGDYNNDGNLDACVTSWNYPDQLYRNLGDGNFEPDPASPTFPSGQTRTVAAWGDYDNDGWLDLFIAQVGSASRLFHNRGDGTLDEVMTGSPVSECHGYGSAWGDYDNDGFLDLCATDFEAGAGYLYRNNLRNSGNTNGWLKVQLAGAASNRSGIGATIRVKATIGGREFWQMRQIACHSYESALLAHFGLGDATNVDMVPIEWPSGIVQTLTNMPSNQILTVNERQGYTGQPPAFTSAATVTNGLQLTITEPTAGAIYTLEASTNLVNWTTLMARTSAGGASVYTDTHTTSYSRRFYRVVVP